MNKFNLLIACDKHYYETWGINFLKSLRLRAPWLALHCHLVNVSETITLKNVDYSYETTSFVDDKQKLAYLQSVRFLAVANKFKNDESVITVDCDSLCVKSFSEEEFSTLFEKQYVLQYLKDDRWLAGFVTFKDNYFRQKYAKELLKKPINDWPPGWDQDVLKEISEKHNFVKLEDKWISVGKYRNAIFYTTKGSQKFKERYIVLYNNFMKEINDANII
jgi:hypothetical protein